MIEPTSDKPIAEQLVAHAKEVFEPLVQKIYPKPDEFERFSELAVGEYRLNSPGIELVIRESILPVIWSMVGGKGWRPFFSKILAESFEVPIAEIEDILATEHVGQGATLGLDDIMDNALDAQGLTFDPEAIRRNDPAVYTEYGIPLTAAVSTFVLHRNSYLATFKDSPESVRKMLGSTADTALGQAIDVGFNVNKTDLYNIITLKDHETMCLLKTGDMFKKGLDAAAQRINEYNLQVGGKLIDADLSKLADLFALVYQYNDDVNGIGKASKIGKFDHEDLYVGNLTRPSIHFLADAKNDPDAQEDRERFISLHAQSNKSQKIVTDLYKILDNYGSIEKTKQEVRVLSKEIGAYIQEHSLGETPFGATVLAISKNFAEE